MDTNVVAVNKIDLAEAMEVDIERLKQDVRSINPNAVPVQTNCRTGEGVPTVVKALGL